MAKARAAAGAGPLSLNHGSCLCPYRRGLWHCAVALCGVQW